MIGAIAGDIIGSVYEANPIKNKDFRLFHPHACFTEDAVRNAIPLGGESDTLACIAGGIAEAFYGGVPQFVLEFVKANLTPDLLEVTEQFRSRYLAGLYPGSLL